jgi:alpha-tubulin suppressor-like RCC1 family protein
MVHNGVLLNKQVKKIFAGGYITFIIATDNTVHSTGTLVGSGTSSPIGSGDGGTTVAYAPTTCVTTVLSTKTVVTGSASISNAMLLTSDGAVYSVGDGTNYLVNLLYDTNSNRLVIIRLHQENRL